MRGGANRNQCGITEYASVFVTWEALPLHLIEPDQNQKLLGKVR